MKTSKKGVDIIHAAEAFRAFAYPDPASKLYKASPRQRWGFRPASEILAQLSPSTRALSGAPWTVGWGETRGVTKDTRMTRDEADVAFAASLYEFERAVESAVRGAAGGTTQGQFDAMVSLTYNIGIAAFRKSSILRNHLKGDFAAAARSFHLYNQAGGKQMPGLVKRRAAESAHYLSDMRLPQSLLSPAEEALDSEVTPQRVDPESLLSPAEEALDSEVTPQRVDPERPLAASEINRASVAAGGTAAVAATAEVARSVADVKYSMDSLGEWIVPILLIAVVGLCGYIVWQRWLQRRGGWS